MAQKVTAMDVRMAAALAGHIDNVAQFCRDNGISRETFYKFRRRFRDGGIEDLQDRSRRPLTSPGQTPVEVEDLIVLRRKQLIEEGLDHGAQSIVWSLQREGVAVPSVSTVWQILTRRGAIIAQPQKRPKSATKRFCFDRPNECWQSDWTGWALADGSPVGIAGSLDDHSRYVVGLRACAGDADAELVWEVMLAGIDECGIPSMSLADNGIVYTGRFHAHESAFEINLRTLGVRTINSTPFHPQTCGKIERFWQTLKKWLAARDPAATIEELNALLEQFRTFYNNRRPHRALGGATPAAVFGATAKARPAERPAPAPVLVSRHTVGQTSGYVFVAPYKVNVGLRWAGHDCHIIRDGEHITILSGTKLVRSFTADPTRRYQRGDKATRTYRNREPKPAS
jgi:transposase InsO family protein